MMKRSMLAIALATSAFVAVPTLSHAANDGFFVNGAIGQSSVNKDKIDSTATGYQLNGGYRWALAPQFSLGAEVGYTGFGRFKQSIPLGSTHIDAKGRLKGWTVGANARFDISPEWYLSARGGLFRWDGKADGVVLGTPPTLVSEKATGNDYYAGAGFGYNFSNNTSVGLNYDYYKASKNDIDLSGRLISVSAEYRF